MQIYRFDAEVSVPIDDFGSVFRIGRLTGDDTQGRVQVIHLGPGGRVGRHHGELRQLFAVVMGSGWVSGGDGQRREIHAGQAAVWEPNEEHGAISDVGLTAVCVNGSFAMKAVAVTADIAVVGYASDWPEWFERIHAYVWPAVKGHALRIDHVGSTSVPGLAAKPIIDMDIVVTNGSKVRAVINDLRLLDYQWVGDLGVEGRQALDPPGGVELPPHHLYLVVENNKAHLDHILLRDALRNDPEARRQYADLKRANVDLAQGDMDVYVAAKARFVADLLTQARARRRLPPASYWIPQTPGMSL